MSRRCSLCMIVKDEAALLPASLDSVADLVSEMIVLDTGSSDQTRQVAAGRGARVFDFRWCDDFAAARNEALRHATGDWIFWLDADERLDDANREKLRALFAALPDAPAAYSMRQRSPGAGDGPATAVDQVRLFRRDPAVRWEYRVHEQLLPSLRRAGHPVHASDIVIEHAGYQDPALTRRKLRRNLRLLLLDEQGRPDDPFVLFNLGWAYLELGRDVDAIPLLERSLQRSQPADSIVPKLYALLAQALRRRGLLAQALAVCRAGRVCRPDDAELVFLEASLHRQQGDLAAAEVCWCRLTEPTPDERITIPEGTPGAGDARFGSAVEGLRGQQARHQLALLYRDQGRLEEAEGQWRAVLALEPAFVPAWLGLGELYLAQAGRADLEQVAQELGNGLHRPADADLLRARALLTGREFDAARDLLEDLVAREPNAVPPRVYLSHVCLQRAQAAGPGRPAWWDAAEQALRSVLRLDPGQASTWRNLALLLWHERQRPVEALAACRAGRFHCPADVALSRLEEQLIALPAGQ